MEERATVLSQEQQAKLDAHKASVSMGDAAYLRAHPEVRGMMDAFFDHLLEKRPADVMKAAVQFFSDADHLRVAVDARGDGAAAGK